MIVPPDLGLDPTAVAKRAIGRATFLVVSNFAVDVSIPNPSVINGQAGSYRFGLRPQRISLLQ
jgi:hypothetical protein